MGEEGVQRRLAAILAADVAGYTRLMEADEEETLASWWAARKNVIDPSVANHRGRIVKHTGDGFLAEFPTATEAVKCAIAMQTDLVAIHGKVPEDRRFAFRMGINLGEIVADHEDIYGEGVNLAARLEGLAEPGGICISEDVYRQVRNKLTVDFEYLGEKSLKHISEDAAVYHVSFGEKHHGFFSKKPTRKKRKESEGNPTKRPIKASQNTDVRRARVSRHIKVLGAIWAALLVIDIGTGGAFWAFWPGIVFATVIGLESVKLFFDGILATTIASGAVIVTALLLINLITWSGYPWFLWPAGALAVIEVIRRTKVRSMDE